MCIASCNLQQYYEVRRQVRQFHGTGGHVPQYLRFTLTV